MASDLIPPPSPAGRPEPDSSDKTAQERERSGLWAGSEPERPAAVAAARAEEETPAAGAHVQSRYRSRFGFVLGALIGVAIAAVALGVVLAVGSNDDGVPDGWSAWRPSTGDDLGAARQIAEHVGPKYRLGDGDQLVAVLPGKLEINDVPLSVAIRTSANGGDIQLLDGHGIMYTLNGLGPHGSIVGGTASKERHLLLRREALELALYTFRYAKGVDMVVTLLPPSPQAKGTDPTEQPPTQALFFRPGDLKGELDVPLTETIAPRTPRPERYSLKSREGRKIDTLTMPNLFAASFQQGQDTHAFLVLDRLTP
jgi:hypothetical protein